MSTQRFDFDSRRGYKLCGRLDLPEGEPRGYAVHAHCFSCSKDGHTAARASRELARLGIGVLRFDFAGLGSSEGDFADTNLSTNFDDLDDAVSAMVSVGRTPRLLFGHSWGGAAALAVGGRRAEIGAVVTLGTTAEAAELETMLRRRNPHLALARNDSPERVHSVQIGPRSYRIRQQLFDDAAQHDIPAYAAALGKPLLVLHAVDDELLGMEHALRLFTAAQTPKSLVMLDGADHLLSRREQNHRVAHLIAAWAEALWMPPPPA